MKKKNIIQKGIQKTKLFFNKKLKKIKKQYLLKKYFYLLKYLLTNLN